MSKDESKYAFVSGYKNNLNESKVKVSIFSKYTRQHYRCIRPPGVAQAIT